MMPFCAARAKPDQGSLYNEEVYTMTVSDTPTLWSHAVESDYSSKLLTELPI
jgi:hypothetical protein